MRANISIKLLTKRQHHPCGVGEVERENGDTKVDRRIVTWRRRTLVVSCLGLQTILVFVILVFVRIDVGFYKKL